MGLIISVYKSPLGDCTNGGVSSKVNSLTVVSVNGPFDPSDDAPAVMLVLRNLSAGNVVCLRPAVWCEDESGWVLEDYKAWMMGGNYGSTSDSRFTEAIENLLGHRFYGAVAIHDRTEQ